MTVEIKSIEIQIGKKVHKLSLEEAQELQRALNQAFPVNAGPNYLWWPTTPCIGSDPAPPWNPVVTPSPTVAPAFPYPTITTCEVCTGEITAYNA